MVQAIDIIDAFIRAKRPYKPKRFYVDVLSKYTEFFVEEIPETSINRKEIEFGKLHVSDKDKHYYLRWNPGGYSFLTFSRKDLYNVLNEIPCKGRIYTLD